ncbi:hypothetical protein GQ53DRAFT_812006 [Thozetella sp. PMI_491]|nr:hypothetical protein GQ53DRAFT_812006 [Thozetella sp. PMI_491]
MADDAAALQAAANKFISEVWGLQGAAYLVVGLRYYSRIATLGWRKLAWDDFLMVLAVLVYTAESVMAYLVVAYWKGLANNAMTDEQRAALDPLSEEYTLRVNGSKTHVVGLLLYTTLLWLLKGCWVVYYSRLAAGVQKMRYIIIGAIVIMPVTYISCLMVAFFKCIPFDHQWQIYPNPGNHCMPAISTIQTIYVMVMNTITDFYLMAIPLPIVWQANLPWKKKLVLLVMFSGGFLEMAFGILRCVSILTLGDTDPAQSGYWSVRESFVSVVLTNMPMVYPLVRGFLESTINSMSRTKGNGSNSNPYGSNGYRLDSRNRPGRSGSHTGHKHPLSLPGDTRWGSEENIVRDSDMKTTGTGSSNEEVGLPVQHPEHVEEGRHRKGGVSVEIKSPKPKDSKRDNRIEQSLEANRIVVTHEYTVVDEPEAMYKTRGGKA